MCVSSLWIPWHFFLLFNLSFVILWLLKTYLSLVVVWRIIVIDLSHWFRPCRSWISRGRNSFCGICKILPYTTVHWISQEYIFWQHVCQPSTAQKRKKKTVWFWVLLNGVQNTTYLLCFLCATSTNFSTLLFIIWGLRGTSHRPFHCISHWIPLKKRNPLRGIDIPHSHHFILTDEM